MKLSDEHGAMERAFIMMGERRAQLGMAIDMRSDDKAGEGVHVLSVNPGGPAEAAGVRANDMVTSLNGRALKGDSKQPAARQLLDVLRAARPGEALPIEFRHEGKLVKAKVVPTRPDPRMTMQPMPGMPGMAGHPLPGLEGHPGMSEMQVHMLLQDGDVLLDIDGRVPASVGHAMQILGSYNPGEKVKLHLMRQKQRFKLAIDLPDGG